MAELIYFNIKLFLRLQFLCFKGGVPILGIFTSFKNINY